MSTPVPSAVRPQIYMISTTTRLQPASQVDMQLFVAAQSLHTAPSLPTEEVEENCINHAHCAGKAMQKSNYCATCEGERKCLNYPICEEKPTGEKDYCNWCLDAQESCERCDQKVGPNEILCDSCMQNQCEKDNGLHWWSNSNSDSEMASGDV